MKKCHFCGSVYPSQKTCCPVCRTHTKLIDDFVSFAPDLADGGGGFKATYFAKLANLEDKSFWFSARNRLIIWMLGRYFPRFRSFLEIGCGTGYVLKSITEAFPIAEFSGSEIFSSGLAFAASRVPNCNLMQMDARNIPFMDEFDVIGAFDVLEHIEEDKAVLNQIHQAMRPSGLMLLTVPQHPWLWSSADVSACHVRRYTAKELHNKVNAAGFEILRSTSFVFFLLPAMWISRLRKKNPQKENDAAAELNINPYLNEIFKVILYFELLLIKAGVDFPFGGSRLVIAKKI